MSNATMEGISCMSNYNLDKILNTVINADCVEAMKKIEDNSIDVIFADPPYNLQLGDALKRPDNTDVKGVYEEWDSFESIAEYDRYTKAWMTEARRILKEDGTIWVIGSYHNIFRVGYIMQDLGFWILNDIIWNKTNPIPMTNNVWLSDIEYCLWFGSSNTQLNDGYEFKSKWYTSAINKKDKDKFSHPTIKPLELVKRHLQHTTQKGDIVLDCFSGSGTTCVAAKELGRQFIGIEIDPKYHEISMDRLNGMLANGQISFDTDTSKL